MNPARVGSVMLTYTELSGYLSRCPRKAELAYRVKYALDDTPALRKELKNFLRVYAAGVAAEEKWPIERGKYILEKMAILAVDELRNPVSGDNWQLRAKALGVNKKQWNDLWRSKYAVVFSELNDWTNTAFRQVWRMQE